MPDEAKEMTRLSDPHGVLGALVFTLVGLDHHKKLMTLTAAVNAAEATDGRGRWWRPRAAGASSGH